MNHTYTLLKFSFPYKRFNNANNVAFAIVKKIRRLSKMAISKKPVMEFSNFVWPSVKKTKPARIYNQFSNELFPPPPPHLTRRI